MAADPRIVQYIKKQMKAGFGEEHIYQKLLNSGWRKENIDEAVYEAMSRPKETPALKKYSPKASSKSHFLRNVLIIILLIVGLISLSLILSGSFLFATGAFNPETFTSKVATGFGELGTPSDWQYSGTTLKIVLKNQVGQDINVISVFSAGCSEYTTPADISRGGTRTFTLTSCAPKSAGDSFSQQVTVQYSVPGGLPRTAEGTITGIAGS